MADNTNFRKELLQQNGMDSGEISQDEIQKIKRLAARDKTRVTRVKWATGIAWSLLVLCLLMIPAAWFIRIPDGIEMAILLVPALFWIAVFFTVVLFIRARAASTRQIQSSLVQIQAQLERLSKDSKGRLPNQGAHDRTDE